MRLSDQIMVLEDLDHLCPIGVAVMTELFYIDVAQYCPHWPHGATEHLKCGYYK